MHHIMIYFKKLLMFLSISSLTQKIILKKSHLLKIFVKFSSKIFLFRNLWEDPRSRIFSSSKAKIFVEKNH